MVNFEKIYKELRNKYGKPSGQWKLWCKRPKTGREREEVAMGAILTQRTNWNNVQLAISKLKEGKIISLQEICRAGKRRFAPLIKPSGFYKTKAGYLLGLAGYVVENYGTLEKMKERNGGELRKELLGLKGIGPETADSLLLYGLDKPFFVIDEYTRRLVKKRKMAKNLSYDFLQKLFKDNLKKDYRLYQDFHALIVIDGKNAPA
jgi:endonuclease-3 related protein